MKSLEGQPFTPQALEERLDRLRAAVDARPSSGAQRRADELLYDSAAALRLVDNLLDELRISPEATPASTSSAEVPRERVDETFAP